MFGQCEIDSFDKCVSFIFIHRSSTFAAINILQYKEFADHGWYK